MSPRTSYTLLLRDGALALIDYLTEHGELTRYSVTLIAWHAGGWHTVRVYDNAHGMNEMHRHTLSDGKQPAETFHYGDAGEAFRDARAMVEAGYEEMITGWLR